MRLIDADALLEALKDNGTIYKDDFKNNEFIYFSDALDLITNAPTVQREESDKRIAELKTHINDLREALEENHYSNSTEKAIKLYKEALSKTPAQSL